MVAIMTTLDFSNPFPTNVTCSVLGIKGVSMTKDSLSEDILPLEYPCYDVYLVSFKDLVIEFQVIGKI